MLADCFGTGAPVLRAQISDAQATFSNRAGTGFKFSNFANLGSSVCRYGHALVVPAAGPRDHSHGPGSSHCARVPGTLIHLVRCARAAWRSARIQLWRAAHRVAVAARPSASLPAKMRGPFPTFVNFENLTVLNFKSTERKIRLLLTPQLPGRG